MRTAFNMTKQRCYNPKCRDYHYYGGRGITICKRWLTSFDNFLEDMGVRPEGMTLERKENSKGYTKSNCVWASRVVQSSNTRTTKLITWMGITACISEWERALGWKAGVLKARLRLGYTTEQAFTKPVKPGLSLSARPKKQRSKESYIVKRKGLDHPLSKLSRDDVINMRNSHQAKGTSFSELARQYGVTVTTASNAVQFKGAYKDV